MKTDAELRQDVINELNWEPTLKLVKIDVGTKDGIVQLSGTVDSFVLKLVAERTAGRVSGVKEVTDSIRVKLPKSLKRSDEDISDVVANLLDWNVLVPRDHIKITVKEGVVTLTGEVDWGYQKYAAEESLHYLKGIAWFSNQITVKPVIKPENLKAGILSAFRRNALLDSRCISLETIGSKVILTGSVRSWMERAEAQWSTWAAPGVSEVENKITVNP